MAWKVGICSSCSFVSFEFFVKCDYKQEYFGNTEVRYSIRDLSQTLLIEHRDQSTYNKRAGNTQDTSSRVPAIDYDKITFAL